MTPKIREKVSSEKVEAALREMTENVMKLIEPVLETTVIVGIQKSGVVLVKRIAKNIQDKFHVNVPLGTLDITLYRDDFSTGVPRLTAETNLNFDLDGKTIVLVDDVLYTGRTVRAALNELMDFGRPKRVRLAVLIDRGHRELPIAADVAPLKISTDHNDLVILNLKESDGQDEILICDPLP
jgi:pyrimidine operon attenuation protein/uracil phosphoribosyltransferase